MFLAATLHNFIYSFYRSVSFVIAECFSKLMKQNIIPNAKNVKGKMVFTIKGYEYCMVFIVIYLIFIIIKM